MQAATYGYFTTADIGATNVNVEQYPFSQHLANGAA